MAVLLMFLFPGIGNVGTFKQTPIVTSKRQADGAIGLAATVTGLGPFIVDVALSSTSVNLWFWLRTTYYVIRVVLCWIRYTRSGAPFPD